MSDRKLRSLGLRVVMPLAVLGSGSAAALLALPTGAGAATLVTPASLTGCFGSMKADATGKASGQPNLLDYSITCNTDISSYTVFVVRPQDADNNIQQYASNPSVVNASTGAITSEGIDCEGVTPSDGVNCYAQAIGSDGKTPVLGDISAWYATEGSISLDEPYCKYLPKGAKPGTAAVPRAVVEYVVTDNTGAEDGPFVLPLKGSTCPKVPNAVPARATKTPKKKAKRAAVRHTRSRRLKASR